MKPFLAAGALALLAACSSAPASMPTPSAVNPTPSQASSVAPSTTTRAFTAAEEALLQAAGWSKNDPAIDSFLASAHSLCATLAGVTDDAVFTSMKEAEPGKKTSAGQIMLLLCDDSARYAPILVAVDTPGALASGTYYVGDAAGELKPGAYRTIGAVQGCYWERKNPSGGIIYNDLVRNAPGGVRLSVKKSDHEVTMRDCGIWIPS